MKRGPDGVGEVTTTVDDFDVHLFSSVLHMRGEYKTQQPFQVDQSSYLLYNGELFGVESDSISPPDLMTASDTEIVAKIFRDSFSNHVSQLHGPFAIISMSGSTFHILRDILGRRSLCIRTDTTDSIIISSVADSLEGVWQEIPATGYLMFDLHRASRFVTFYPYQVPSGGVTPRIEEIPFPRKFLENHFQANLHLDDHIQHNSISQSMNKSVNPITEDKMDAAVENFYNVLKESIRKRVLFRPTSNNKEISQPSIGVLFSGGVDSSVIAFLAHEVLPENEPIDLVNISFMREEAPDRITARAALEELKELCPLREWRLVCIDVTKGELEKHREQTIKHLIYPLKTVLDDSIGCAIWFAAGGAGYIEELDGEKVPYISTAKILLHGLGSDEQLAGYSRHRRVFDKNGLTGLIDELNHDLDNLHSRNLGRDDRLVSDHGKEARFPFLDENVVSFLNSLPIAAKCDLTQPRGVGDKRLLRLLAQKLGLQSVSSFEKRAIQFGSRIAKISNTGKEKGNMISSRLSEFSKESSSTPENDETDLQISSSCPLVIPAS